MRDVSLMTVNMMFLFGLKYMIDQDREDFEESWLEMMDIVRQSGFRAVDITMIEADAVGEEKLRRHLGERDLAVSSFIYLHNFAENDEPVFSAALKDIRGKMELAARLGTDTFMLAVNAITPGKPEGMTREAVHAAMLSYFAPLAEYGRRLGLHVVVEDTPDLRFHLNRAEDLRAVLDAVPGLEVVFDSGNMLLTGEDPVAYFRCFAGRVSYIHLQDAQYCSPHEMFVNPTLDGRAMKAAPTGTGVVDMPALLSAVKASGYDRPMTVEFARHPNLDWVDSLKASREYFLKLLND